MGRIDKEFYIAVCEWNKKKSLHSLKLIWREGFSPCFIGFKIWRIIRNTINGRYKQIEQDVLNGKITVK